MSFLRIVSAQRIENIGYRAGFLDAAYRLQADAQTPDPLQQQLSELIDWFRDNLAIPDKFNRSKSKGAYRRNTKGLSWFKPDATMHINKAFEVCAVLKEADVMTEILRTDRVGFIVFEDPFQVVAEPFSDTPT